MTMPDHNDQDSSNTIEMQSLPPYVQGLNEPQRKAVLKTEGPLLVLAGAGTGKTRVLTTRLGHILATGKAFPSQILSVTFTNKAAAEMKQRVSSMLGGRPVEGWWLGTFHALGARMLRAHAEHVGLKSNFTILDPDDQQRLIKQILEAENINVKDWPPRLILSMIERWKDRALTPDKVPAHEGAELANGKIIHLYKMYQSRLRDLNACDFGDLLLHMITLFQDPTKPDILNKYHTQFKYILVDEYQDTNVAQYLWLRLLAMGSDNICCVGDDDQSIYGWRGAEVGNILRFGKDFPGAEIIRLEQNYRSTGHILGAASSVISFNKDRHGKTLWTEDESGEKVHVKSLWDGEQEARWIAEEIESMQLKGKSLNEIAVLVRASSQMREFEERFVNMSIPYRVVGGPRFYERMEIRDAIAYLRVMIQPADDLAFERIINKPKRGVGPKALNTLYEYARMERIPLTEATIRLCETDELPPKLRSTLIGLMNDFARWRSELDAMPHHELAQMILDESGYTGLWMNDKSPEAAGRLENLKELIIAMAEFDSLAAFIEHVSLVMDTQNNENEEMVSLMTLHSAKGLEFDFVFLPGWEEGIFPNQRSLDESGISALEEERRLAYVGITRAKKRAHISFAANRRLYGSRVDSLPSRFISELPKDHTEVSSMMHIYSQSPNHYGGQYNRQQQSYGHNAQYGTRSPVIEGRANPVRTAGVATQAPEFHAGKRVFHDKFGYGTILSVDNNKLDIHFEKSGRKKVLSNFVTSAEKAT